MVKLDIYKRHQVSKEILKRLEQKTEVDYCGLFEEEVIDIIYKVLKKNGV